MYKSNCKNCDHNIHFGFCPVVYVNYSADGDPGDPMDCGCDEYIPSDNLEFLEYRYVRRSLKV
jgi:hypothetical protein